MSAVEAVADFIHAMECEGVKATEPIAQRLTSGDLIRFRCEGDGKGRQNGWAILYLDEKPAGAFGNYRLGLSRKWRVDRDLSLSPEERRRLSAEWAEAKQRRMEERERCELEAAREAVDMWARGIAPSAEHAYLAAKRLDPAPLREFDGRLIIPMVDGLGKLWNLQRIAADGTKRFLRGGRTDGLFNIIGKFSHRGETCCIGEGYATMAAVHRASGHPCIAAFSTKNMAAVARLWNEARPDLHFVICADDDPHLIDDPNIRKNLGLVTAKAVAEEIGAKVAIPTGRAA